MRKNITTCRTYVVTCLSAPLTAIAIMVLRPSLIIHSGAKHSAGLWPPLVNRISAIEHLLVSYFTWAYD